ncbi:MULTISPECIES: cation:proton antiporter subunit C [Haloferax]|uniref:Cation:proton antiporter n=2 Tax=Haloferax gibbonsii TaxID=35746 RepID=A0A0K1IRV4_HALGI|nr:MULTISPECIES: cation:proton antiporter subunit C [Haloferax]AKU07159.1 cation:proton antiporter [Haloferax gibbonsii]ELZ76577.1 monovalent cation/H+ antiporter subunit C [Haloferax gibbonsii ATCC 33959]QOS11231.1 Mrp-type sodium/proton antiporter system subunit C [Haloferax gibbonsii]RDZ55017.1 cation:proton antiporter [Haloferax sp. Atlit-4N]REA05339.1 cation:proton antiporter [Haloferax sp. Atlit-6N]
MIDLLTTHYNYVASILLFGIGLYVVMGSPNLVKKIIGMNIFQVGIFLFFVTTGYVDGGAPPVVGHGEETFVSPLPHVLILTAIVVGVSLTAVALALVIRIYDGYGSLDEDVIKEVQVDD